MRVTIEEVSLRPTPSKINSPGPISPVTRPSTVTVARLTLWRTARIEVSWRATASAKIRGRFEAATAEPQSHAAAADNSGKNNCSVPPPCRAGGWFCTGDSFFLRGRRRDGAADILPAGLRRQENRRSKTRLVRWPYARFPATRATGFPLASESTSPPHAPDEFSPATGFRRRKYCPRRGARSGPKAAL